MTPLEIPASARTRAVAVGAAVLSGSGLALQARLNGWFGARLGDGVAAALITTALAMGVLVVIVPSTPAGRRGVRRLREALRAGELRRWQCVGGVSGALLVAGQAAVVGTVGVGVFTVAVVGGTSAGSLAVDRLGLGPGGRRAVTPSRVVGAVACVVAVGLAGHAGAGGGSPLLIGVPVVAGLAFSVQSAINGRVAGAGSPAAATMLNFMVASLALCVAFGVELGVRGVPAGHLPREPWLYAAGLLGICVIAVATVVVRLIGVLVFGLASVCGQLAGAVALDTLTTGAPPWTTWLAVLVTLAAVVLVVRPR